MTAPFLAHASAAHAFGSFEGVLIASWRREVNVTEVRDVVRFRNELASRGLRGAIHIFEEQVKLPSPEVRKEASMGVASRVDAKPAIGLVFYGSGFAVSALRAAGTAIFVLRSGPPTRMFADVPEASQWLVAKSATHLTSVALRAACEQIRFAGLSNERSRMQRPALRSAIEPESHK